MDFVTTTYKSPGSLSVETLDEAGYASLLAEMQPVRNADSTPVEVVIQGLRVRLHTDRQGWRRFWSANWFTPNQWASLAGRMTPSTPEIQIFAAGGEGRKRPWAGYSADHRTAFLMGDTPYGALRALTLGAVGRLLAEREAAHLISGICLERDGVGMLWLYAPDGEIPGLWTKLAEWMAQEQVHLVAWGAICIRYGFVRLSDGVPMLPTSVIDEKGGDVPGYHLFPWLDAYGYAEPRADARCLTLAGEIEYCFARDLDLGRPPDMFAFPLEQSWYVPTRIVAGAPELVGRLWEEAGLENVPPLTPELREQFGDWAQSVMSVLQRQSPPAYGSFLDRTGEAGVFEALCRLRASPDSRALVAPQHMWPKRTGGRIGRPVPIEEVARLERDGPVLLEGADLSECLVNERLSLAWDEAREIAPILGGMLARSIERDR